MRKTKPKRKSVKAVVGSVIAAAHCAREFGVPDMVRFKYARETPSAIIVTRQNGRTARIGKAKLAVAVRGVRRNHRLYIDGPAALREIGITHVNSPIYALLRLVPLNNLIE